MYKYIMARLTVNLRPLPLRDVGGPALAPERRAAPLERQGPPGDLHRVGVLLRDERRLGRVELNRQFLPVVVDEPLLRLVPRARRRREFLLLLGMVRRPELAAVRDDYFLRRLAELTSHLVDRE